MKKLLKRKNFNEIKMGKTRTTGHEEFCWEITGE